jgi:hypothetical protein
VKPNKNSKKCVELVLKAMNNRTLPIFKNVSSTIFIGILKTVQALFFVADDNKNSQIK